MTGTIKVAICGAAGRMGRATVAAVCSERDLELVAAIDRTEVGTSLSELVDNAPHGLTIKDNLSEALQKTHPKALVDFTNASSAAENALAALQFGAAPIIGTTGLSKDDLARIATASAESGIPALVVPNFAIGAVLMMRFAEEAAKWLPHAEIIEMHHDAKADAPSGTAMLTAHRMGKARQGKVAIPKTETLKAEGARGAVVEGVPVHSVRMKGLLAHQIVMFGGPGEVLTIRHDSLDRASFVPGVLLAIRKVRSLEGLVSGLDSLLFE